MVLYFGVFKFVLLIVPSLLGAPSRPIAGAYVKVYAKLQDGGEPFWKDLYTDLRGRADYWSVFIPFKLSILRSVLIVSHALSLCIVLNVDMLLARCPMPRQTSAR